MNTDRLRPAGHARGQLQRAPRASSARRHAPRVVFALPVIALAAALLAPAVTSGATHTAAALYWSTSPSRSSPVALTAGTTLGGSV